MTLLTRILKFARVVDLLYTDEDHYTHLADVMKDLIASLLNDPMQL